MIIVLKYVKGPRFKWGTLFHTILKFKVGKFFNGNPIGVVLKHL